MRPHLQQHLRRLQETSPSHTYQDPRHHKQLLDFLRLLHDSGRQHRDLIQANILVGERP